jgi:hypothetical protein
MAVRRAINPPPLGQNVVGSSMPQLGLPAAAVGGGGAAVSGGGATVDGSDGAAADGGDGPPRRGPVLIVETTITAVGVEASPR